MAGFVSGESALVDRLAQVRSPNGTAKGKPPPQGLFHCPPRFINFGGPFSLSRTLCWEQVDANSTHLDLLLVPGFC